MPTTPFCMLCFRLYVDDIIVEATPTTILEHLIPQLKRQRPKIDWRLVSLYHKTHELDWNKTVASQQLSDRSAILIGFRVEIAQDTTVVSRVQTLSGNTQSNESTCDLPRREAEQAPSEDLLRRMDSMAVVKARNEFLGNTSSTTNSLSSVKKGLDGLNVEVCVQSDETGIGTGSGSLHVEHDLPSYEDAAASRSGSSGIAVNVSVSSKRQDRCSDLATTKRKTMCVPPTMEDAMDKATGTKSRLISDGPAALLPASSEDTQERSQSASDACTYRQLYDP